MLKVVIKVKRGYKSIVSSRKEYSVIEANTILIQLDKLAEEKEETPDVIVSIFEEKEEKFQDIYRLGEGRVRSIILLVTSTLETTFKDGPQELKTDLLNKLTQDMMGNDTPVLEKKSDPTVVKKTKKKKQEVKERQPIKFPKLSITLGKPLLIGFTILLLSSGVGYLVFGTDILQSKSASVSGAKAEVLADYLNAGDFKTAGKKFPKDHLEIVDYLVSQKLFKDLEEFNRIYSTPEGIFDLAFHDSDWQRVVDTPITFYSKNRRTMLCYSFIRLGQLVKNDEVTYLNYEPKKGESEDKALLNLAEAIKLNSELKDKDLTAAIASTQFLNGVYYLELGQISEAEKLKEGIIHPDYPELIATAKILVERIEVLKKDKKDNDANDWAVVLGSIGKEYRQENDSK